MNTCSYLKFLPRHFMPVHNILGNKSQHCTICFFSLWFGILDSCIYVYFKWQQMWMKAPNMKKNVYGYQRSLLWPGGKAMWAKQKTASLLLHLQSFLLSSDHLSPPLPGIMISVCLYWSLCRSSSTSMCTYFLLSHVTLFVLYVGMVLRLTHNYFYNSF